MVWIGCVGESSSLIGAIRNERCAASPNWVAAEAEDLAVRSTTEAQPERIEAPDNADVLASWRNFLRFIIYFSICLRREHWRPLVGVRTKAPSDYCGFNRARISPPLCVNCKKLPSNVNTPFLFVPCSSNMSSYQLLLARHE